MRSKLLSYLCILSLLIPSMASSAIFPTASTLTVGGRVFTDLTNLIVLVAVANGSSTVNATFRKSTGVAGYTPSVAKKFRVMAAKHVSTNSISADNSAIRLLYSDNDVGMQSSTAFINPVGPGSIADAGLLFNAPATGASWGLNQNEMSGLDFLVPNGKFIGMTNTDSGGARVIYLYGYEE